MANPKAKALLGEDIDTSKASGGTRLGSRKETKRSTSTRQEDPAQRAFRILDEFSTKKKSAQPEQDLDFSDFGVSLNIPRGQSDRKGVETTGPQDLGDFGVIDTGGLLERVQTPTPKKAPVFKTTLSQDILQAQELTSKTTTPTIYKGEKGSLAGLGSVPVVGDVFEGFQNFKEGMRGEDPATRIPYAGDIYEINNIRRLSGIANKIERGEEVTEEERKFAQDYVEASQRESKRFEDEFGYAMGSVIGESATFMAELAGASVLAPITGGGSISALIGSKGLIKGGKELVERFVKDKAFRKIISQEVGKVSSRVGLQVGITGTTNIPRGAYERMVGSPITNEQGDFTGLADDGQSVSDAVINSTTAHLTEVVSERSGGIFTVMGRPVKNAVVKSGILKALIKKNPTLPPNAVQRLVARAGWNGVLEEFGEERIADVANGVFAEMGLGDIPFEAPTMRDMAVELASFAFMGSSITAANVAFERFKVQVQEENPGDPQIGEASRSAVNNIRQRVRAGEDPADIVADLSGVTGRQAAETAVREAVLEETKDAVEGKVKAPTQEENTQNDIEAAKQAVQDRREGDLTFEEAQRRAESSREGKTDTSLTELPEGTLRAREEALQTQLEIDETDAEARQEMSNLQQELERRGLELQAEKIEVPDQPSQVDDTPENLRPLAEEARRFDSAEEFVEAQPKVFHGSNVDNLRELKPSTSLGGRGENQLPAIYTSDSLETARFFARENNVQKFAPKEFSVSGRILDVKDTKELRGNYPNQSMDEIAKSVQDDGFDIVRFSERANGLEGREYAILNPDAIKTKSQLTDLFNRVKGADTKKNKRQGSTEEAFSRSTDQTPIAERGDVTFEIGTFGKNALDRKKNQEDRLDPNLIPETIENISEVRRGSDDPNNFRHENNVYLSEVGGETRALITRKNDRGNEEIINFFKVGRDRDTFISNLGGVPSQTRTGTTGVEDLRSIQLTDRDISTVLAEVGSGERVSDQEKEIKRSVVDKEKRMYELLQEFQDIAVNEVDQETDIEVSEELSNEFEALLNERNLTHEWAEQGDIIISIKDKSVDIKEAQKTLSEFMLGQEGISKKDIQLQDDGTIVGYHGTTENIDGQEFEGLWFSPVSGIGRPAGDAGLFRGVVEPAAGYGDNIYKAKLDPREIEYYALGEFSYGGEITLERIDTTQETIEQSKEQTKLKRMTFSPDVRSSEQVKTDVLNKMPNELGIRQEAEEAYEASIGFGVDRLNKKIEKLQDEFDQADTVKRRQEINEEAGGIEERMNELITSFTENWDQRWRDRSFRSEVGNKIIQGEEIKNPQQFKESFDRSEEQQTLVRNGGLPFEMGTFGRDTIRGLKEKRRPTDEEIALAIPNTVAVRRPVDDSGNVLYDNTRWLTRPAEGQMIAIDTRKNSQGREEIVVAWRVNKDPAEFWQEDMGSTVDESRIGPISQEAPRIVNLTDNTTEVVPPRHPKSKIQKLREERAEQIDRGAEVLQEITDMEQQMQQVYLNSVGATEVDGMTQVDEVLNEILTELELAEPGSRVFTPSEVGGGSDVTGIKSTFPDWIPQEDTKLRTRKYADYAIGAFESVTHLRYPQGAQETARRKMADALFVELDKRLDVDTSGIRNQILETYDQEQENISQFIRAQRALQRSDVGRKDARPLGDFSQVVPADPEHPTLGQIDQDTPLFQRADGPHGSDTLAWIENIQDLQDVTPEEVSAIQEYQNSNTVPSDKIRLIQSAYRKYLDYINADRYQPAITSQVLEELGDKTTVNKQFIRDMANRKGIKQGDKDAALNALNEFGEAGDRINVDEFKAKMSSHLLTLDRETFGVSDATDDPGQGTKYPFVRLPIEERLDGSYREIIYNQDIFPYDNSHFGVDTPGYFAHVRTEDSADGRTRRILEIQSDLMKAMSNPVEMGTGGLEWESVKKLQADLGVSADFIEPAVDRLIDKYGLTVNQVPWLEGKMKQQEGDLEGAKNIRERRLSEGTAPSRDFADKEIESRSRLVKQLGRLIEKLKQTGTDPREALQPYKSNWWQRIIREEIKRASRDGVTTLQFPGGKTAMRIEGLVGEAGIAEDDAQLGNIVDFQGSEWMVMDANADGTVQLVLLEEGDNMTISDFKDELTNEVKEIGGPSDILDRLREEHSTGMATVLQRIGLSNVNPDEVGSDGFIQLIEEKMKFWEFIEQTIDESITTQEHVVDYIFNYRSEYDALPWPNNDFEIFIASNEVRRENVPTSALRGEVDTSHAIYKLYEEKIQGYLRNTRDLTSYQDQFENEWYETTIRPEEAEQPIPAFRRERSIEQFKDQPITIEEATNQLNDYRDRLGVDFPAFSVQEIYTGEKDVSFDDQRGRARGVSFSGMILLAEGAISQTTVHHEMVHETLNNWHLYDVFRDLDKMEIYRAANDGKDPQTANDIERVQEILAEQYQQYEVSQEQSKLPEIIRTFFERLRILIGRINEAFGGNRDTILDYFRTLKYARSRRGQAIRRQADFEALEEIGRTIPDTGDVVFDFGLRAKFAARRHDERQMFERMRGEFKRLVNEGVLRDNRMKDINIIEDILGQTHDMFMKDPNEFEAAKKFELAAGNRIRSKARLDRKISEMSEPYFNLKKKERAELDKVLVEGDRDGMEFTDNELYAKGLNETQVEAYKAIRKTFDVSHEILLNAMIENGVPMSMIQEYRETRKGYVPHKWQHGNFVKRYVINPETGLPNLDRIDDYRTKRQVEKAAAKLARENTDPNVEYAVDQENNLDVNFFAEQGLSYSQLRTVINNAKTSDEVKTKMLTALKGMFKEKGFGRHFIQRSGVGGFETQDLRQPIADYFAGLSGFITKSRAAVQYYDILSTIDNRRQPKFWKYISDLMLYDLGQTKEFQMARSIAFTWYLANDLSFLVTNSTQNWIIGVGELSKYIEGGKKFTPKAEAMMAKATKDWVSGNVDQNEKQVIDALLEEGELGGEMVAELTGFKNNPLYALAGYGKLRRALYVSTNFIESSVNRVPAFLAARRLFLEQGFDSKYANEHALEFSKNVHFRYGKANRPRFMRGPVLSTVFVFNHYIRSYLFLLYRNVSRGDFMAFGRQMFYTTLIGGTTALPFAGLLKTIFQEIFGWFDDEEGLEEIKQWEIMLTRGAPALAGVDMSGRVGADIIMVESVIEKPLDVRSWIGAAGNLPFRWKEGVQMFLQGRKLEAVDKMAPDVIGNIAGAVSGYRYGVTSTAGTPLTTDDGEVYKYNGWEAVVAGAGITPTRETILWNEKSKEWIRQGHEQGERTKIRRTIRGQVQRGELDAAQETQQQARTDGLIGEQTNYVREFAEEPLLEESLQRWNRGEKNRDRLEEIENDLINKIIGEGASDRQKLDIRKKFAVRRNFGDNTYVRDLEGASTNDEKLLILGEARRELGQEGFREFFNTGRKTIKTEAGNDSNILISDALRELYIENQEALIHNQNVNEGSEVSDFLETLVELGELNQDRAKTIIEQHRKGKISTEDIFNRDF